MYIVIILSLLVILLFLEADNRKNVKMIKSLKDQVSRTILKLEEYHNSAKIMDREYHKLLSYYTETYNRNLAMTDMLIEGRDKEEVSKEIEERMKSKLELRK